MWAAAHEGQGEVRRPGLVRACYDGTLQFSSVTEEGDIEEGARLFLEVHMILKVFSYLDEFMIL